MPGKRRTTKAPAAAASTTTRCVQRVSCFVSRLLRPSVVVWVDEIRISRSNEWFADCLDAVGECELTSPLFLQQRNFVGSSDSEHCPPSLAGDCYVQESVRRCPSSLFRRKMLDRTPANPRLLVVLPDYQTIQRAPFGLLLDYSCNESDESFISIGG